MLAVQSLPYILGAVGPILLGITLLVVLRLLDDPSRSSRSDPVHWILAIGAWVLIAAGVLAVCALGLAILPVIAAPFVIARIFHRRRRSQQQAFLWALTVAAERMMPLGPVIEAFAEERRGVMSRRARRLAAILRAGGSLPQGLQLCRGLVSPEALTLIHVGHQAGALAPGLRQVADNRSSQDTVWNQMVGRVAYLCLLLLVAVLSSAFMAFKIAPAFQKIMEDFGMPLTALAQVLSSVVVAGGGLMVWAGLLLFLVLLYAILRYIGWIRFDLPGTAWLSRRLETAWILDALALIAQQQRPLPEGIATLARSYPRWSVRRRLVKVSRDLQQGDDWGESLVRHKLLQPADLAVLQSAQRLGNLPWALKEMADSNRRRVAYRAQRLLQVLFPLTLLAFGAWVAAFVIGYFIPLCEVIQRCV